MSFIFRIQLDKGAALSRCYCSYVEYLEGMCMFRVRVRFINNIP